MFKRKKKKSAAEVDDDDERNEAKLRARRRKTRRQRLEAEATTLGEETPKVGAEAETRPKGQHKRRRKDADEPSKKRRKRPRTETGDPAARPKKRRKRPEDDDDSGKKQRRRPFKEAELRAKNQPGRPAKEKPRRQKRPSFDVDSIDVALEPILEKSKKKLRDSDKAGSKKRRKKKRDRVEPREGKTAVVAKVAAGPHTKSSQVQPTEKSATFLGSVDLMVGQMASGLVAVEPKMSTSMPPPAMPGAPKATTSERPASKPSRRPLPPRRSKRSPTITNTNLDRYKDEGQIARGGMSAIHLATDRRLKRRLALKTFLGGDNVDLANRFIIEAQITSQLDHPNIVPVHELGLDSKGVPQFMTMKLVRGKDLREVIWELGEQRVSSINIEKLVRIVIKACEAVSFAHSHGVVHRDLKPANMMVGSHGQVYVMDWGLALLRMKDHLPEHERMHAVGTPAYMAPEQAWARIEQLDERTDVFGMGGILYAVLTGRPPYVADTPINALLLARKGEITSPEEGNEHALPPELCRITMKALSADPLDRYQSVVEFQQDLDQFLRGGGWLVTRTFAPGETIVRQGDIADEAFIVVSGTCEAYKTAGGRKHILATMGPGEVFGETLFLTGRRRGAYVRAVEEVVVKIVTLDALDHELEGNNWMHSFITVLSQRFRELSSHITKVELELAKERER